jgi:hypothetical protein
MQQAGVSPADVWLWGPGQTQVNHLSATIPGAQIIAGFAPTSQAQAVSLRDQGVVGFDFGWGSASLTPATIALIQTNGMLAGTFTLNDPERMLQAINLNLDFIETDFPALLNNLMAGAPNCLCDSIDFNNDGSSFDPQDIDALLSVYAEGPCIPADATCNEIDFNNDGSIFDPCDIDSFLLVYAEGPCTRCGE